MSEEKIKISVNEEDVQNIINCYEKDIEYIKELEGRINKALEYIEGHSKESEVKIYGIPKCKIFMGSVEELLDLLKGDKE